MVALWLIGNAGCDITISEQKFKIKKNSMGYL
jgi:hypothetical protein